MVRFTEQPSLWWGVEKIARVSERKSDFGGVKDGDGAGCESGAVAFGGSDMVETVQVTGDNGMSTKYLSLGQLRLRSYELYEHKTDS